ncbi:MAG: LUD domain-containing protein [Gemmatimonadota bacterium]|nr:LUD domain-containing protein [Gemmatimonadota bacterium]
MSARDDILAAVRRNLPRTDAPLPEIPRFAGGGEPAVEYFRTRLELMGGRSMEVPTVAAAEATIGELFPDARVVCSAVPEIAGTRRIEQVRDPHELHDVEVGVFRARLGVAEAGAVWVTQEDLVVNTLAFLSQHLVVLLDPAAIVNTLHDAYDRMDCSASPYGVLMAGPSATGDIEGVIIRGAQGARSLTVLLLTDSTARNTATA